MSVRTRLNNFKYENNDLNKKQKWKEQKKKKGIRSEIRLKMEKWCFDERNKKKKGSHGENITVDKSPHSHIPVFMSF